MSARKNTSNVPLIAHSGMLACMKAACREIVIEKMTASTTAITSHTMLSLLVGTREYLQETREIYGSTYDIHMCACKESMS